MNAFHVLGGLLAVWALVVSFLGVTREGFPGSRGSELLVTAISVVLVLLAISAAIVTSATEEEEESEGGEEAALVLAVKDLAGTRNPSDLVKDLPGTPSRSNPL
ncbi:MAG: hypothetical protein H0U25_07835 [Thermoleophilaceae bacterium]|nr:hypothetical protein [Thermoleophilaceae bacterium]